MIRYKRPDKKNALSILDAIKREMEFTMTIKPTEASGPTIIRNIYECFRMLGDALLVSKGIKSEDHLLPINEIMDIKVETTRPTKVIDNLRRLRHNINYYGYKPNISDVKDAISLSNSCFEPLYKEVLKQIKKD